ncbi:hypothetical protein QBC35DRAFT_453038 [Podospora australis]|uniref:DUF8021 domain-containing protein n=1 Tax=Podospora australis TaxID=1536484 RepID=A0AAN6WUI7_9PEZI|nr:hypothetical protein QBC35DRAFT_453038 [Podospora australis]
MARLLPTLLLFPLAALAQTRCQWANLRSSADLYTESQTFGTTSDLIFSSSSFSYLENSTPVNLTDSLLNTPLKIAYSHSIIDQDGCATFSKLIITGTPSLVIGTQIFYESTLKNGQLPIKKIDTVIIEEKNTTGVLGHVKKENWESFTRAVQDSREVLVKAVDGWLDGGSVWGETCATLTGSTFSEGEPCSQGLGQVANISAANRRYVVDESVGAVSVLSDVGGVEARVVGGKLRYVHLFRY